MTCMHDVSGANEVELQNDSVLSLACFHQHSLPRKRFTPHSPPSPAPSSPPCSTALDVRTSLKDPPRPRSLLLQPTPPSRVVALFIFPALPSSIVPLPRKQEEAYYHEFWQKKLKADLTRRRVDHTGKNHPPRLHPPSSLLEWLPRPVR